MSTVKQNRRQKFKMNAGMVVGENQWSTQVEAEEGGGTGMKGCYYAYLIRLKARTSAHSINNRTFY